MSDDDQTNRAPVTPAEPLRRAARRLPPSARRLLVRALGPYRRRRMREAHSAASLASLQAELEHVRKRHDEQIERLEDLARESILAAEALRCRIAEVEERAATPHEGGAER